MRRFLLPFLALPLLAGLCAWIGNSTASNRRRLSWYAAPPTPVEPRVPIPSPVPTPAPAPVAPSSPLSSAPVAAPVAKAPSPAARPIPAPAATSAAPVPAPPAPAVSVSPESAARRFPFDPGHLEREISSEEALEAFHLGLPFFDARRSSEFESGHIPGAHSAPVWEDGLAERLAALAARSGFPARKARLTAPVVVYCSGGTCEDSHLLAEQLFPLGFGNVLIYTGGLPDWAGKGRPVVRGPEAP